MNVRLANTRDIQQVSDLRMEYLRSVYSLNEKETLIKENNCMYLRRNLNKTCYVALGFKEENLCSCAYMTLIEKAARG